VSVFPPTRRSAWPAGAIVIAVALAGCAQRLPATSPVPSAGSPAASALPGVAGLLVAAGGPLRVTTEAGELVAAEPAVDDVRSVSASGEAVAIVHGDDSVAIAHGAGDGLGGWSPIPGVQIAAGDIPAVALGDAGRRLVIGRGSPNQATSELAVVDARSGVARTIDVRRALNGPPSWLGPDTVVVDVIGRHGQATLAEVRLDTGAIREVPGGAYLLAANDDGSLVALDDPTGAVLIGTADAWRTGHLETMTRLPPVAGLGVANLALDDQGRRLAVLRRADDGTSSIDLFVLDRAAWRPAGTLAALGGGPVSLAWRGA
jgi:hypothetical protein